MTAEPSRIEPDAWGLTPAIPDPPPLDTELGVVADSREWGTTPPTVTSVTRGRLVSVLVIASGFKARYLLIRSNTYRRKRRH